MLMAGIAPAATKIKPSTRKLVERLGVTTGYVTHDQVEAMTLADRMVVMHDGCIQQVGRPLDIYARPANTFVASFIGTNNELRGTIAESGALRIGSQVLHGADRSGAAPGEAACLCIRPSAVRVGASAAGTGNGLRGTVARVAYLGDYRDVLIDLPQGLSIRAFVDPDTTLEKGRQIDVSLPVEHCQILSVATS